MKILAIDTSCDETAAAITENTRILSNVIWSQASAHAKFGGVMPSLAQRMHEERIDWVIEQAIKRSKLKIQNLDYLAVTIGPGLSIALGVGIDRARKLAEKYGKPLIAVNHLEGHLLSPLANSDILNLKFPNLGLVISGGNTIFIKMNQLGSYEILAQTTDDALGEALDKAARMLGLGYPGGAILEKLARLGNPKKFSLPIPLIGQENRQIFSYSGLKTSFYRLIEANKLKDLHFPSKHDVYDLAATFQNVAFTHLIRIISYILKNDDTTYRDFFVGGGVSANIEIRKRLRNLAKENGLQTHFPYTQRLCGDNAAMIGIAGYFYVTTGNLTKNPKEIDRDPNLKLS